MSILKNIERVGNFTSSRIIELTSKNKKGDGFGAPYIEEKNIERRLGRSVSKEVNAKPLSWGQLLEKYVFEEKLGLEYTINSKETIPHPEIPYWVGSPDGFKIIRIGNKIVMDIKAPYDMTSFVRLVQPIYDGLTGMEAMNEVIKQHKDGRKYYLQLVSNAIISGCDMAELIIFCPYQSELEKIRTYADGNPKYYWIWASEDEGLPYLTDGGYYNNLNKIEFEIPKEDKQYLTEIVLKAGEKLLNSNPEKKANISENILKV